MKIQTASDFDVYEVEISPYPARSGFLAPWQASLLGAYRWLMSPAAEAASHEQLQCVGALLQAATDLCPGDLTGYAHDVV